MLRSALIFKVNKLGDSVVFLPVVQRLCADATFERITLWTTPIAAPLYSEEPGLRLEIVSRDDFYPAWKSPRRLLELTRKARAGNAEIALITEDMGNTAYLLALLSGAQARVGARMPFLKIPAAINREVQLDPLLPAPEKAWRLGSAFVQASGGAPWSDTPPVPDLSHLNTGEAPAFEVLIHPGASREYQRWPLGKFAELAVRLSRKYRVGWIQAPGSEMDLGGTVSVVQTSSLNDFVSLLSRASLLIANNSGPMHVASALGVPSVVLCGPSARQWDPYWHKDRFRILRYEELPCIACDPPGLPPWDRCTNTASPMACMHHWTVDLVEGAVEDWYARWSDRLR